MSQVEPKDRGPGIANMIQLDDIYPLVKTELFGVHAIQRSNYWFRNVLFPKELEAKDFNSYIVVSEDDKIVPSLSVERELRAHVRKTRKKQGSSKIGIELMHVSV